MSNLLVIKGWIECIDDEINVIHKCIDTSWQAFVHEYKLNENITNLYKKGWVFQENHINGMRFVFFGANINRIYIDLIEFSVRSILTLNLEVSGYFEYEDTEELRTYLWKINNDNLTIETRY